MLILLLEVFQRQTASRSYLAGIAVVGFLLTAFVSGSFLPTGTARATFGGMAWIDGYTQIFTSLFCLAGALTAMIAPRYLQEHGADRGEFYALLLFSVAGMIMMVAAADLVVFFVALEIMSIAVYALAAYTRRSKLSSEAGFKYFVLGAFASAILLYGIALVYGATGTTNLAAIGQAFGGDVARGATGDAAAMSTLAQNAIVAAARGADVSVAAVIGNTGAGAVPLAILGATLILIAFSFKIAAVPFHMWAPDAYTGAPTPVVGFMAAAVKAAGVAALFRVVSVALFSDSFRGGEYGWVQIFFALALLSMVVGNLVALVQGNIKRMLAYSSVAHAGYMLVAFTAVGFRGGDISMGSGLVFYLFAYTIATIGAFGVLSWLGSRGMPCDNFEDLDGVGYRYPWIGLAMSIFMLSAAGIPPAAGFIGKFLVFKSAVAASAAGGPGSGLLIFLVVTGILVSVAGVYYYLRVIVHLYMKKATREVPEMPYGAARWAIVICAVLTLALGVLPGKLVNSSEQAVGQMAGRADGVYQQSAEAPLPTPGGIRLIR